MEKNEQFHNNDSEVKNIKERLVEKLLKEIKSYKESLPEQDGDIMKEQLKKDLLIQERFLEEIKSKSNEEIQSWYDKKTDKIKYPEEFKKIIDEIDPMPK